MAALERFWLDARFAARTLGKSPGFTAVAVVTLALGIGANTAIFSLFDAYLLRPIEAANPERLAGVFGTHRGELRGYRISYADYADYRDRSTVFSELAALSREWVFLNDGDEAWEVIGSAVSGNFFPMLGLEPHLGRFFGPEEDAVPDAHPVTVLSHELWRTRFDADPGILGRTLRLNSVDCTVIGVAPEAFRGVYEDEGFSVWVPTALSRALDGRTPDRLDRARGAYDLLGRLAPGRTLAEARSEMTLLSERLATAFPETHVDWRVAVEPSRGAHPRGWGEVTRVPARLAAAVGALLLIVCANLAGLLTARNSGRGREIAVRLALGGRRGRLVAQLMTEGLLLALAGGAAGLFVAFWTTGFLESFFSLDLRLSGRAFLFTFGASVLTGVLFTLVPALQATGGDLVPALKEGSGSYRRSRLRAALVTAQIALSLVLLVGAGLLLRSLERLITEPGFDAEGIAHFRLRPGRIGYDGEQSRAYHRDLIRRLEALPGVRSVALARVVPQRGWCCAVPVSVPGGEPARAGEALQVENNHVTPGFLDALGIPLVLGRDFDERDRPGSPGVVIVNEALAQRLWPGGAPLGQRLAVGDETFEVVGLTPNTHPSRSGEGPFPYLYFPFWQRDLRGSRLFVKVAGDPGAATPELRRALLEVDPYVHVGQEVPLKERRRWGFQSEELLGRVFGTASLLGLFLSALGLYGTMAFAVGRRRREFGVRTALGARPGDVLRLVLGQGLRLVLAGLALGWVAAYSLARTLSAHLYGVEAGDMGTYGAVTVLIAGVALAASYVPALEATRVAPSTALRHE